MALCVFDATSPKMKGGIMSDDLLTAAIDCALDGCRIFPCVPRDKNPLTEHGLLDATNDPDQVWWWWERWPDANIGMATGYGRIVLDVDGTIGRESLAALEAQYGALVETLMAKSGRPDGGVHFHFAYAGNDIRNSAGRIGKGLDVRGFGGYIILPPSVHETGNRYRWINDIDPAPLPEWLRMLMLPPKSAPRPAIAAGGPCADLLRRGRVYLAMAEGAGEGTRNGACFRLAGHLGALVGEHRETLGEDQVFDLLIDFNRRCTPPLGEVELRKAVHSGMTNGKAREPKPSRPPAHIRLAMTCAGGVN